MKIAILGAGAFGTALGGILLGNGYNVDYYDPIKSEKKLANVLDGAEYTILCVPSGAVSTVLPEIPRSIPLIVATKGILSDSCFVDFEDWMAISGPGFADDIKAKKKTKLTITDDRLTKMFGTDYMEFDSTKDRRGVLMCGALKNVYAILAGFLDLRRDTSEWNQFILNVSDEMMEILDLNGAERNTVKLACGILDLKLTCDYPSRNYEFGEKLRLDANYRPEKTVEGFTALNKIKHGDIKIPKGAGYLEKLLDLNKKWF